MGNPQKKGLRARRSTGLGSSARSVVRGAPASPRARGGALSHDFVAQNEGLVISALNSRLRRMGMPGVRKVGNALKGSELAKDLHQEGLIGLWNASRTYRPGRAKPSTFAVKHIQGAIGRALKRQGVVRLGEREVRRRLKAGSPLPTLTGLSTVDHERASSGGLRQAEAKLRLTSLSKHLSPIERKVLHGSLGATQAKLGRQLRMSKGNVNKILMRAKRRAREREAA